MYLNCRAMMKKKNLFAENIFIQPIRLGFGPKSLNPLSKNFFLSLNDRSESAATDKSD